MVWASITHQYVFDYHDGDVYWCTADVGWITGHTYLLYGPLANGGITLMNEGVPNYPDVNRFSQIVDKHKVNILYTAPTAIRWCGVQNIDLVLINNLRETVDVRVIRHTFVHQSNTAIGQRAVKQVSVTGNPAHIRGTPVDITIVVIEHVLMRNGRPHHIA